MGINKTKLFIPTLCCTVFTASLCQAQEAWKINGFGSLAVTHTGNDTLAFPNYLAQQETNEDNTYWGESLLGVQLDYHINHLWQVSSQAIAQDSFQTDIDNYLRRLFIQYDNGEFTARFGRVGSDVYMLSDYRNVGFAYIWAHPSMEFYGPFTVDYYDGLELGYTLPYQHNQFQLRFYAGSSRQLIHRDGEIYELKNKPSFGANLQYDTGDWLYRVSTAYTKFTNELPNLVELGIYLDSVSITWPEAADYADILAFKDTRIEYYSTGIRYEGSPWLWQTELSFTAFETSILRDFWSGYTSLGYQFDQWTLFSMAGVVKPTESAQSVSGAPSGLETLQAGLATLFKASANQRSFSLGFRWDVWHNVALKAQWDRTWIEQYGDILWVSDQISDQDEVINTFSLKLDFVF